MQAPPQAPLGPLHVMHLLQLLPPAESKVAPPQARTLDSLAPFYSDLGQNLISLMHLKSAPRPGLWIHWIPAVQTLVRI